MTVLPQTVPPPHYHHKKDLPHEEAEHLGQNPLLYALPLLPRELSPSLPTPPFHLRL